MITKTYVLYAVIATESPSVAQKNKNPQKHNDEHEHDEHEHDEKNPQHNESKL